VADSTTGHIGNVVRRKTLWPHLPPLPTERLVTAVSEFQITGDHRAPAKPEGLGAISLDGRPLVARLLQQYGKRASTRSHMSSAQRVQPDARPPITRRTAGSHQDDGQRGKETARDHHDKCLPIQDAAICSVGLPGSA
jgi:hypothetical protein